MAANATVDEPIALDGDEMREVEPVAVMGGDTLSSIVRAEIDMQISTAKAYPRSLSRFHKEVLDMATLNPEVAAECMYVLPRDGKKIDGPSARLAEIVLSAWGNARGGARVVDESEEFITAQGFMHDLERNVAISFEVRRRITDKSGRRYKPDMIGVTANAASSIAFRNAVFKVVPKAYWNQAYKAARGVVRGDVKTLADRRATALSTLAEKKVTVDQVIATLGVQGVEDIGLDELVTLRGMLNAIEEGDTTVEQAFGNPKRPENGASVPTSGIDAVKTAVGAGQAAAGEALGGSLPAPATAPAPSAAAESTTTGPIPKPVPVAPKTVGEQEKEFIERRSKEIRDDVTGTFAGTFQEQLAEIEKRMKLVAAEWQATRS